MLGNAKNSRPERDESSTPAVPPWLRRSIRVRPLSGTVTGAVRTVPQSRRAQGIAAVGSDCSGASSGAAYRRVHTARPGSLVARPSLLLPFVACSLTQSIRRTPCRVKLIWRQPTTWRTTVSSRFLPVVVIPRLVSAPSHLPPVHPRRLPLFYEEIPQMPR